MTATTEILDLVQRWTVAEQDNAQVRDYGTGAAVVIGALAQETSFQGGDNSGRFRVTVVAVRPADRWLLANVHIGPLQPAGPPSA
jgi:hypothetical protein